ncbi:pleckstrin homology domain-containing family A member 2 [Hypomesus transpacificus]|uniref:pleckstrin homology domain-containing family A member 2 n=1 Tax=Hypomesus transpacificus TaxID=137520 RepID=UPI001F074BCA|nr:pleckstrin homology domain-containing family A member 2 [Hypomesus transpacificus]
MPYLDRLSRVCGFLDIEEQENSGRFQRRYFILDTQGNTLLWYMDNPQNLPSGASAVGSLRLTYISKVSEATLKQKPKTEFCFVINSVSRRYYLQANDPTDMKDWVVALNKATKITVPKAGPVTQPSRDVTTVTSDGVKPQQAYRAEIIGGVVVHTPIYQNNGEESEIRESKPTRLGVLRCGFCVKQGNVRKSWKRRFFILDHNSVSYYKCASDKEPLRAVPLRDIQKVHECLVKSGELLTRDNLFEIITSSRIFYVQTDSPEDMHGWIRDIQMKIQDFRGPPKGSGFKLGPSLCHSGNRATRSGPQGEDRRPPLVKSCSVAPGWQPWTPLPQRETSTLPTLDQEHTFSSLPAMPSRSSTSSSSSSSLSSSSTSLSAPAPGHAVPRTAAAALAQKVSLGSAGDPAGPAPSVGRRRHHSHPQPPSRGFPYVLDEDGIRTTDV